MNNYKIKFEAAPHMFVEVGFFSGDASALATHLHTLRAATPGRYVAEAIEATVTPDIAAAPRKRRKPKE